jgi:hypothetical protein
MQTYKGGVDEWTGGSASWRKELCRKRMKELNKPYCDIVYGWASSDTTGYLSGDTWAYMMKTNDKCPLTVSTNACGPFHGNYAWKRSLKGGGKALRWE